MIAAETPTTARGDSGPTDRSGGQLQDTLRLLVIVTLEVGAFAGLMKLGSVSNWRVDWAHFWSWLQYASLEDALAGILRWVALVLTGWLLASSVLYILARLTRVPALIRGTGWLTLPVIRAVVDRAVVVTVAASTVIGSRGAVAWAHPVTDPQPPAVESTAPTLATGVTQQAAERIGGLGAEEQLDHRPAAAPAMATRSDQAAPEAGAALLVELAPAGQWEVRAGDHLWAIAANRVAGASGRDPDEVAAAEVEPYWRSLVDQNRSRLRSGRPGLIYAGERLALPPVLGPRRAPAADLPPTSTPTVAPPGPPPAAGPPSTRATPPAPTSPTVAPPSTVTPLSDAPRPRTRREADDGASTRGTSGWTAGAGLIGATALASWALLEARRRRSRQLRKSRAGQVFPPPDPTLGPITAAVRANADVGGVDRLDAALRHLAGCCLNPRQREGRRHRKLGKLRAVEHVPRNPAPCPQVILRQPNNDIEVFLAEPIEDAVGPWQPRAHGAMWALPHDAALPEDPGPPIPCAALVQLGKCEDDAELYADLEALGTLGLQGAPEAVRQIARALTATVVVSPAAQLCRVLTYGFDPYGLDEQARPRLIAGTSLDALLDEAEATARPVAEAVAQEKAGSSFRLRAVVPEEGWEPAIVIVAGSEHSREEDRRLSALGGQGGRGAAVVKAGSAPRWSLEAAEPIGWWRLNPLGILVQPVGLAGEELRELAAFLADADAQPVEVEVATMVTTPDTASPPPQ
ncbi:MAG: hypothetical protein M3P85_02630, partial [Actinomycetota bacterium]|nr:hypothetical protein [Actinomycetota bacterium]